MEKNFKKYINQELKKENLNFLFFRITNKGKFKFIKNGGPFSLKAIDVFEEFAIGKGTEELKKFISYLKSAEWIEKRVHHHMKQINDECKLNVKYEITYFPFVNGGGFRTDTEMVQINPFTMIDLHERHFKKSNISLDDLVKSLLIHEVGHFIQNMKRNITEREQEFLIFQIEHFEEEEILENYTEFMYVIEVEAWDYSEIFINSIKLQQNVYMEIRELCLGSYKNAHPLRVSEDLNSRKKVYQKVGLIKST